MPAARRKAAKATKTAKATKAAEATRSRSEARKGQREPEDGIVLTGPPSMLRATVTVANAVDERVQTFYTRSQRLGVAL